MSGSVFKRCSACSTRVQSKSCARCGSTIYKWAYTVDVGKDANGKRRQKLRGGFQTKKEAERGLHELQTTIQRGSYVPRSGLTVRQYLLDEWLPATAPPRVRYETWNDRQQNLNNYVVPRLGDVLLQDLNAAHLNRLYAELLKEGRTKGPGGLSPTSVRRIHAMLRKALKDATRWGRVERNATDLTDPPPAKVVQALRKRSMTTWSEEHLRTFLSSTAPHALHDYWLFAALTGVRRSELLGLSWNNLNISAGTATIRQVVINGPQGYLLERDQKSISSGRTLHLSVRTTQMLSLRAQEQQRQRAAIGPAWHEHDLVFCRPDGTWWNPPAISLSFRRAVREAPVPVIRLHDLRHTHATLLLAAGVNPKVVSERLGHSSVSFTLDTYSHVMPGMQPDAAELFDHLVFNDSKTPASTTRETT